MENSEYRSDDYMYVETGKVIEDSVSLHELAHQILNKTTYWGLMIYFQHQMKLADRSYTYIDYHTRIKKVLMDAAEETFESHATLLQFIECKEI